MDDQTQAPPAPRRRPGRPRGKHQVESANPRRRRVLAAIGVLTLIVLGGAAALVFAFPAESVGALAAERASEALDRDVSVERIRLKLVPVPAVALEGVRIERWRNSRGAAPTGAADGEQRPLAAIRRVEVRPHLLPLLRREVIVRSIVISDPSIVVEVEDESEPVGDRVAERTAGFLDDASFDIRSIRVRNGRLEYRDRVTAGVALLEGIDQDLRIEGLLQGGEVTRLALSGWLDIEAASADMPASLTFPLRELPLRIEHEGVLDLADEAARFERLSASIDGLTLEGNGTIDAWSDPEQRRLSLRLAAADADLTRVFGLLPADMRTWPAGAAVEEEWRAAGGRASVEAVVEGRLGNGELPRVDGSVDLASVSLARGGEPIVTDLTGRLGFSLDGLSTDGLSAQLLGEPLRLAITVSGPEELSTNGRLSTRLDLARATALGLLPEGWTGVGLPGVDVTFSGPLARPLEVTVDGSVTVAGVEIGTPEWPARLAIASGSIGLAGQEVVGRSIQATLADSDASVDFALADWLPYLLDAEDTAPRLVFESRSRLVNADALIPPDPAKPTYAQLFFARLAGAPVGGLSATEAAEAAGYRLPELPPLIMEGRVLVERLVQRGAEFRDLDVQLAAAEGQLQLRGADFTMLGGGIHLTGRLGAASNGSDEAIRQPLTVEFQVRDVESDPFLERFTVFRDHLAGTLGVEGTLAMELDRNLLPEPATLVGGGEISVTGGELVNWSMVRALGSELGIARFDTIAFEDWSGRFEMLGSRIVLRESSLDAGDLRIAAAGSFDVSGQLDLAGTVHLGSSLTSRLSGTAASTLVAAASDPEGRVPVGLRLAGTAREPSVRLDFTEAGLRLADRAREEAEARARELATEAASRVLNTERESLLRSPEAVVDSVGQAVGGAVMGRLRGLIGRQGRPAEPEAVADSVAGDTTG